MRIFGFFSYRYIFGANFGKISQSQTFRDEIMAIYVGFSFYRYICIDLNFLRDSERRAVRLSFLSRRHALSHRPGSGVYLAIPSADLFQSCHPTLARRVDARAWGIETPPLQSRFARLKCICGEDTKKDRRFENPLSRFVHRHISLRNASRLISCWALPAMASTSSLKGFREWPWIHW